MINKINEIKEYTKDRLTEIKEYNSHKLSLDNASNLHNELFNTSYYIIGSYTADKWLGEDTFEAIRKVKRWSIDNFGKCNVDFSNSEEVANLLAYIIGKEILHDELTKLIQEEE
jgi:hypothetical protein